MPYVCIACERRVSTNTCPICKDICEPIKMEHSVGLPCASRYAKLINIMRWGEYWETTDANKARSFAEARRRIGIRGTNRKFGNTYRCYIFK